MRVDAMREGLMGRGSTRAGLAWARGIGLAIALGLAATVSACGDEGPAERAGQEMEESAEEADGAFEELGREIGEAADESKEAAEKLRQSTE